MTEIHDFLKKQLKKELNCSESFYVEHFQREWHNVLTENLWKEGGRERERKRERGSTCVPPSCL